MNNGKTSEMALNCMVLQEKTKAKQENTHNGKHEMRQSESTK